MTSNDTRKLSPKAQEALQMRAVQAVVDGTKQVEVARVFGVTARSINTWVTRPIGPKVLKA